MERDGENWQRVHGFGEAERVKGLYMFQKSYQSKWLSKTKPTWSKLRICCARSGFIWRICEGLAGGRGRASLNWWILENSKAFFRRSHSENYIIMDCGSNPGFHVLASTQYHYTKLQCLGYQKTFWAPTLEYHRADRRRTTRPRRFRTLEFVRWIAPLTCNSIC